jgi:hypothetical protein
LRHLFPPRWHEVAGAAFACADDCRLKDANCKLRIGRQAVKDLELIAQVADPDDMRNRVYRLPL